MEPYKKFDVKAYLRGEPQPWERAKTAQPVKVEAPPEKRNEYQAWANACEGAGRWDLPFPVEQQAVNNWGQIPPAYSLHVAEALKAAPDAESVLIAKIVGPLLLRLEGWGKNAGFKNGDARRLLADLFEAAGPHRQHHMPALFEMCVGVSDRAKVEWLRRQVDLVRRNDAYFPRERPEIRDDTSRNAVLTIIRQAPDQTADIAT